MKILVISDSHRNLVNCYKVLDRIKDKIDAIIHLGDVIDDVEEIRQKYSDIKIYNVAGNCDWGAMEETEKVIEVLGKRIFITHGHSYNVKSSIIRLAYAGLEKNADICLYGHTHFPLMTKYDDMIILNPGSISLPRGVDNCSYGIIDINENGGIDASVVGIYGNDFRVMNVYRD